MVLRAGAGDALPYCHGHGDGPGGKCNIHTLLQEGKAMLPFVQSIIVEHRRTLLPLALSRQPNCVLGRRMFVNQHPQLT